MDSILCLSPWGRSVTEIMCDLCIDYDWFSIGLRPFCDRFVTVL